MSDRLNSVLKAIDTANAADPHMEVVDGEERPAELVYGERMSAELARLCPDASEHLQIAARGQHIERWKLPRTDFPEGRAGYLKWRQTQAANHAARVSGLMAEAGYDEEDRGRVESLLRKEGIKRNPEMQMLEDVICFVFIRNYMAEFAEGRDAEEIARIVTKTAKKMSPEARERAIREFALPDELAAMMQG
ncbi:DUF4202 domain-containing protein [Amaricoccus macauensis]|uniref:DUF4202 domain-containing protein n=1 Tax=Amaricoccus macauensis TaxID=57001 RepID=UPI003C7E517D